MSNTVNYIIQAVDKFSPVIQKFNKAIKRANRSVRGFGENMQSIGKSFALHVSAPLIALGAYAIKTASNFQQLKISFGAFMQAQKAPITGGQMFDKLFQFTKKTPFLFSKIAQSAKMLLTAISYKDLTGVMGILGDAAATTGSNLTDLSRIYMQVNQMGKMNAIVNRELNIRGINIVKQIAKTYKITTEQVMKLMQAGKITAKVFDAAFAAMDAKGGLFYHHMQMQMKSIAGRFTVLHDNVMMAANSLGIMIFKTLHLGSVIKKVSYYLGEFAEKIPKFAKAHPILTKVAVALGVILAIAAPLAVAIGAIAISISVISLPILAISAGVTAAIIGITLLVAWLRKFQSVSIAVKDIWKVIKASFEIPLAVIEKIGHFVGLGGKDHKALIHHTSGKQSAHITVHIKDKGNNVSKVASKKTNFPNLNIGLNMFDSHMLGSA